MLERPQMKPTRTIGGQKVLLLIGQHFDPSIPAVIKSLLREAGASVFVASARSDRLLLGWERSDWGAQAEVDLSLDAVELGEFDTLVILGCEKGVDALRTHSAAADVAAAFARAGKPVAALGHGSHILIDADIVRGRQLTASCDLADAIRDAGAEWRDRSVVQDGNILTAQGPQDAEELSRLLMDAMQFEAIRLGDQSPLDRGGPAG